MTAAIRSWWSVAGVVILALLVASAVLGDRLSDRARDEVIEATGLDPDRVRVDGLDVELLGFTDAEADAAARDRALAAAEALASTRSVTVVVSDAAADGGTGTPAATDADADADAGGQVAAGPDAEGEGEGEGEGSAVAGTQGGPDGSADADADADADDTPAEDDRPPVPEVALTVDNDQVRLTGTVVDEATASNLAEAALGFGLPVVDDLQVASGETAATPGSRPVLAVSGSAGSEAQAEQWRAAAEPVARSAGFDLTDGIEVSATAAALNELVARSPIGFEERRSVPDGPSRATLDEAAAVLAADPEARFRVVGHTDSVGDAGKNQELSLRRAQAVVDYLVEAGVEPGRLEAVGRGEDRLLVEPEITLDDLARNRRIEWEPLP